MEKTHPVDDLSLLIEVSGPVRRWCITLFPIIAIFPCQVQQDRTRVVEDLVVADDEAGDLAARIDFQVLWRVLLIGLHESALWPNCHAEVQLQVAGQRKNVP